MSNVRFLWAHHSVQEPWEPLEWCQPKIPVSDLPLQQPPTHFAARSESAEEGPGVTSNPLNVSQPVETLALSTAGMDLNLTLMQMNHLLAAVV